MTGLRGAEERQMACKTDTSMAATGLARVRATLAGALQEIDGIGGSDAYRLGWLMASVERAIETADVWGAE